MRGIVSYIHRNLTWHRPTYPLSSTHESKHPSLSARSGNRHVRLPINTGADNPPAYPFFCACAPWPLIIPANRRSLSSEYRYRIHPHVLPSRADTMQVTATATPVPSVVRPRTGRHATPRNHRRRQTHLCEICDVIWASLGGLRAHQVGSVISWGIRWCCS